MHRWLSKDIINKNNKAQLVKGQVVYIVGWDFSLTFY